MASLLKSYFEYKETSVDAGLRWVQHYRMLRPTPKAWSAFGHSPANSRSQIVGGSTPGSYFLFGLGGGLDYGLTHKINIRGDRLRVSALAELPAPGLTPPLFTSASPIASAKTLQIQQRTMP